MALKCVPDPLRYLAPPSEFHLTFYGGKKIQTNASLNFLSCFKESAKNNSVIRAYHLLKARLLQICSPAGMHCGLKRKHRVSVREMLYDCATLGQINTYHFPKCLVDCYYCILL